MGLADGIQVGIAIITSLGVLLALYSSNKQIKNTNKQALFEKRLKIFILAEKLKQTIEENKSIIDIPDDFCRINGLEFRNMINNTYLNELWEVIPEPLNLNSPSVIAFPEVNRKFLIQKEELLQESQIAELIYDKPENTIISKFLYDYIVLLDGRRQYDILIKNYRKNEKEYQERNPQKDLTTEEYLQKFTNEEKEREKYLINPIKQLSNTFDNYCMQRDRIKEQIILRK